MESSTVDPDDDPIAGWYPICLLEAANVFVPGKVRQKEFDAQLLWALYFEFAILISHRANLERIMTPKFSVVKTLRRT